MCIRDSFISELWLIDRVEPKPGHLATFVVWVFTHFHVVESVWAALIKRILCWFQNNRQNARSFPNINRNFVNWNMAVLNARLSEFNDNEEDYTYYIASDARNYYQATDAARKKTYFCGCLNVESI